MIIRLNHLGQPFEINERGSQYLDKLLNELTALKRLIGICEECGEQFVHEYDEPFAHCSCGIAEWTFTDLEKEPLVIQRVIYRARSEHYATINEKLKQFIHRFNKMPSTGETLETIRQAAIDTLTHTS